MMVAVVVVLELLGVDVVKVEVQQVDMVVEDLLSTELLVMYHILGITLPMELVAASVAVEASAGV